MRAEVVIRTPRDLGLAIAEARQVCQLTQAQVAQSAGLDRTYLAKMEAGLTTLYVNRLLRVLSRLGAQLTVTLPPVAGGGSSGSPSGG